MVVPLIRLLLLLLLLAAAWLLVDELEVAVLSRVLPPLEAVVVVDEAVVAFNEVDEAVRESEPSP